MHSVPLVSLSQEQAELARAKAEDLARTERAYTQGGTLDNTAARAAPAGDRADAAAHHTDGTPAASPPLSLADLCAALPAAAAFGPRFTATPQPRPLTELETEYVVHYVKHVFPRHIVCEYRLRNTLADQHLEHVSVAVALDDPDAGVVCDAQVEAAEAPYDHVVSAFTVFSYDMGTYPNGMLGAPVTLGADVLDASMRVTHKDSWCCCHV